MVKNIKLSKKVRVYLLIALILIIFVLIAIPSLARFNHRSSIPSTVWNGEVATGYRSGNGTKDSPYVIADGSELAYFASMLQVTDYEDTYFTLSNDIILNDGVFSYDDTNKLQYKVADTTYYVGDYSADLYTDSQKMNKASLAVNTFSPLANFKGHFDGDFYTIYGLYITDFSANELSLFPNLSGDVSNLYLANSVVYGGSITAGVATGATDSNITNVSFAGNVISNADLASQKTETVTLEDKTFSGILLNITVPLDQELYNKGIVKITLTGEITAANVGDVTINGQTLTTNNFSLTLDPSELGEISIAATSVLNNVSLTNLSYEVTYVDSFAAGIIGKGNSVTLTNVINKAAIYNDFNSAGLAGTLTDSSIINSYNTGDINSNLNAASLIVNVSNSQADVQFLNVYNSGEVNAPNASGLVGNLYNNQNVTIKNCFDISNTAYLITKVLNTNLSVVSSYYTDGSSIKNGNSSGDFVKIDNNSFSKEYFIDNLSYQEFIDLEDLASNSLNVWIYEDDNLPILYFDDVKDPIAAIHVGSYTYDNLSYDLDEIKFDKAITFNIEGISTTKPVKELYYYMSTSSLPLTRSEIESINTWKTYQNVEQITADGKYVIYVKVVDNDDKVTYLNTDVLVVDQTPANIEISVLDSSYTSFKTTLDTVYVDKAQEVGVTASEDLATIDEIYYYVSNAVLTEEELNTLDEWSLYTDEITLEQEGENIVYVKAVDNYNYTTYANTDIIKLSGYKQNSISNTKISSKSTISINTTFVDEVDSTDYERVLRSNVLLPLNSKITLIDNKTSKVYTYVVATEEDNFNYDNSCQEDDVACTKYATYPLSLFKEVGKVTDNEFPSKLTSLSVDDDYTIILDLEKTNITDTLDDVTLSLSLFDDNLDTYINTLDSSLKKFTVYDSSYDAKLDINLNGEIPSILYNSDSVTDINLTAKLNYATLSDRNIVDTTYDDKKMGLLIELVDSNGEVLNKENLKNITFKIGDEVYYPDEEGIVRIVLNEQVLDSQTTLQVVTTSDNVMLADGTYYFKIFAYASYDGMYEEVLSSNAVTIPVVVNSSLNRDYNFDIEMNDADLVIEKDGEDKSIDLGVVLKAQLTNPNIRVSLYQKKELTAYNQDYELIDLKSYVTNDLEMVDKNIYYALKDSISNSFNLTFETSKLTTGGYKLVFELYDDNERIGSMEKKFIVKQEDKMKRRVILILFIACCLFLMIGITYSKFTSNASLNVIDQYLAKFVFDAKVTDTISLPLTSLTPGSEKEYSFSVTNNKDNNRSNVNIEYQIIIETFHFMPLDINLYKVVDDNLNLVMTCDETYSRDSENKLVCNSVEQQLSYTDDLEDNYVLKVSFGEEYNSAIYADLVDFLDIKIKSWQKTDQEEVEMKKVTKYLLIVVGILIGIFLITKAFSLARYTASKVWNYYLTSQGFYFSSDYLGTTTIKNVDNNWDGAAIKFNLKNSLNDEVVTDYDINYEAFCSVDEDLKDEVECRFKNSDSSTYEGVLSSKKVCVTDDDVTVDNLTQTECEMNGYTWKSLVATSEIEVELISLNDSLIDDVTVNIKVDSTAPYATSLVGEFVLHRAPSKEKVIELNYDDYSNYGNLVITNSSSLEKTLTLKWDSSKLRFDTTNLEIISSVVDDDGYIKEVKFTISPRSSLKYTFYKTDFAEQYTVSEFTISEDQGLLFLGNYAIIKQEVMMEKLKVVKRVLFTIIAVFYFTFALCMTILLLNYNKYNVTQFGDTSLIIIKKDLSIGDYKKGDLVLVDAVDIDDIQKGDEIFAYRLTNDGLAEIQVGITGEVYPNEDAISYENGDTYSMQFVAGKATKVYSNIGTYLSVIESQWGFLFIVLVPCFLIFIYELYALIVEIKYGADEE